MGSSLRALAARAGRAGEENDADVHLQDQGTLVLNPIEIRVQKKGVLGEPVNMRPQVVTVSGDPQSLLDVPAGP